MACILRLAGEPSVGHILDQTLQRNGHRLLTTSHVAEAFQILARESVDVIIADDCLPGLTGQEFLDLLHQEKQCIPLIVVSNNGNASGAAANPETPVPELDRHECLANATSAIESTSRPYRIMVVRSSQLESAVEQVMELARVDRQIEALRREVAAHRSARQFLASSRVMEQLLRRAATVATTESVVLLEGEPGTGKKLLAATIHDLSDRREQPFLQLQCDALPESLLESALFGHERGAFNGAARREVGAFERGNGGTILLENVGALSPALQVKLLHAIESQSFQRVGGAAPVPVNVRVMATVDRDLAADVAGGRFHAGLYERLRAASIRIRPLRERPEDIPQLALHFARRAARDAGREVTALAPEALVLLQSHSWPGNVRELRNAVERAVAVSRDAVVQAQWFEALHESTAGVPGTTGTVETLGTAGTARMPTETAILGDLIPRPGTESRTSHGHAGVVLETLSIDDAERVLIQRALEVTGQNRTRAAALLGISVRTLRNKLNRPGRQQSTPSTTEA